MLRDVKTGQPNLPLQACLCPEVVVSRKSPERSEGEGEPLKLKDIIPHTTTKAERVKLRQEFARLKRDRQFQTDIRHLLKRSQRNRCFYCNERITWEDRGSWHIDHRIPIYKGGPNEMCNFVVACKGCNLYKGAHTLLRKVKIERREAWMRSKLPEQKPKYLLLKKPERPDF